MRVDFNNLGAAAEEPFWRFIGCCLSSNPEILGSSPDLGDLQINMTLNENSVDLLRAWQLFSNYQSPTESTVQAHVESQQQAEAAQAIPLVTSEREALRQLLTEIEELRDSVSGHVSNLSESFDNAVSYAASAAGDIAADYARDRVHEEAMDNGPDFTDAGDTMYNECDNIVDRLSAILESRTT